MEEFIAGPLEVDLGAVINGYKTKEHALEQLEREEIHVMVVDSSSEPPRPPKHLARSTYF